MSSEPLHGKKQDMRGAHKHIPISDFRKQAYLDWLCTPPSERDPRNQKDFADSIGVTQRTFLNWKDDREFLDEWQKRYIKTIGDPGRKQHIMETLYRTATDGDDPKHVAAAKQYFEIEGSVSPAKMQVEVTGSAKDLSNEQLESMIAQRAADELADRRSREQAS